MKITKSNQLNHSVDQYKLLSSNAGVGAIINTKLGFSIMPLSIENWKFIQRVENQIANNKNSTQKDIEQKAYVNLVEDSRFVSYLKAFEGLPRLKYLVAIPHMQLDDQFNTIKYKDSPLYKQYIAPQGLGFTDDDLFVVPGMYFPRWMVSQKSNMLYRYEEWRDKWGRRPLQKFAPPRDGNEIVNKYTNDDGEEVVEYALLSQMPFVLICPNGHISDIPWDKYFSARLNEGRKIFNPGFDLFGYRNCSCSSGRPKHELFYTENKNHSEGFGVLKCKHCNEVISLEGIMNMKPKCSREKPWLGINGRTVMTDQECKQQGTNKDSTMSVALATANSVYYADAFSSLYIPEECIKNQSGIILTNQELSAYDWLIENDWSQYVENNPNKGRKDYWTDSFNADSDFGDLVLLSNSTQLTDDEIAHIKQKFFEDEAVQPNGKLEKTEDYRFQEYQAFAVRTSFKHPKLSFKEIDLPASLAPYFEKICQVETLCLTKVQTDFYRVKMPVPVKIKGSIVYPNNGSKIYGKSPYEVHAIPANQMFGEGLFFELKRDFVKEWAEQNAAKYTNRDERMGSNISLILDAYGAPAFYLIHTLAHLIIKELEFSCGYSSTSLSERIYYSNRMCGILIYTTDGGDGGMGGLVWQGQPDIIEQILKKSLVRATDCSSDPVCWEHEEGLNYAACFSCAMIAETSCEYRNLGLDRRALIDSDFGFFKDLL